MSTISSVRVGVRPPWTVARVSTHHLILGGMVAVVLLLYAHTLLRYGHAMHTTDGYMYYTHARSWYFDQDCDYENDLRLTPATFKHNEFYLGWRSPTGKVMNVFPCAWSVIALPFVALADLFTILHNAVWGAELPRDGYSTYYQLVVPLAHVLTGVVGLLLTFALLSWYFSNTIAALATAATWCGTNAAYYISFDPTMPHAASMTFVAGTIWSADTIRREGWSRLRALALGLCCGMMIGVRHHNVTWMVVPLIMLVPDLVRGIRSRRPGAGRDVGLVILAAGTAFLSLM
ncbi:MAG: hypothetical protein GY842_06925, partial [bacterium]|nr:hypothetical protein [bacterium]